MLFATISSALTPLFVVFWLFATISRALTPLLREVEAWPVLVGCADEALALPVLEAAVLLGLDALALAEGLALVPALLLPVAALECAVAEVAFPTEMVVESDAEVDLGASLLMLVSIVELVEFPRPPERFCWTCWMSEVFNIEVSMMVALQAGL